MASNRKQPLSNFQQLARIFFRLLKTHHHEHSVRRTDGQFRTPNSLNRVQTWLNSTVHPAEPSPRTSTLILGNALNWTHTTLLILEEHYGNSLENLRGLLRTISYADWHRAWEVALRWAYRRYPHLQPTTLESTRADLQQVGLNPPATSQPRRSRSPHRSARPPRFPIRSPSPKRRRLSHTTTQTLPPPSPPNPPGTRHTADAATATTTAPIPTPTTRTSNHSEPLLDPNPPGATNSPPKFSPPPPPTPPEVPTSHPMDNTSIPRPPQSHTNLTTPTPTSPPRTSQGSSIPTVSLKPQSHTNHNPNPTKPHPKPKSSTSPSKPSPPSNKRFLENPNPPKTPKKRIICSAPADSSMDKHPRNKCPPQPTILLTRLPNLLDRDPPGPQQDPSYPPKETQESSPPNRGSTTLIQPHMGKSPPDPPPWSSEWPDSLVLDSWHDTQQPAPSADSSAPLPQRAPRTSSSNKTPPTSRVSLTPSGPTTGPLDDEVPGPSHNYDYLQLFQLDTPEPFLFRRHEHKGNKNQNWNLSPERPILIIGDSNLSRLPKIHDKRVQVDSYPGATLSTMIYLLQYKTPTSLEVDQVIFCVGLNNRTQGNPEILQKQVKRLVGLSFATFPFALIHFALINFSKNLNPTCQGNLRELNRILKETNRHIPRLPQHLFTTEKDHIHWSTKTGRAMWDHWWSFLVAKNPQ